MAVSPLDMLQEEVNGFLNAQVTLLEYMDLLGGEYDCEDLRQKMMILKQALAVAESSISNRLKGEVTEEEAERHGQLEDEFFELKARYFALLRECIQAETIRLPQRQQDSSIQPPGSYEYPPQYGGSNFASNQDQFSHQPASAFPLDPQQPYYTPQQQVQLQKGPIERDIGGVELVQRDSVYWGARELVERDQEMQLISSEMVHLRDRKSVV